LRFTQHGSVVVPSVVFVATDDPVVETAAEAAVALVVVEVVVVAEACKRAARERTIPTPIFGFGISEDAKCSGVSGEPLPRTQDFRRIAPFSTRFGLRRRAL